MVRTAWIALAAALGLLGPAARAQEPPSDLPPFDPPPSAAAPPVAPVDVPTPTAQVPYDPARFYLPDCLPSRHRRDDCPCGPPGRIWAGADYLYLTTPGDTGSAPGFRSGVRATAGLWLDRAQEWAADGGVLFLGTGTQGPSTADFLGAEANARHALACGADYRFDVLAGYRFFRIDECRETTTFQLATRNQFHGAQAGFVGEYRYGRGYLDVTGKLGLGTVFESTEFQPQSRKGTATDFAVAPATDLAVGLQLSDNCRAAVGYSFVYVSKVARPGDSAPGDPIRAADFWAQGVSFGLELRY